LALPRRLRAMPLTYAARKPNGSPKNRRRPGLGEGFGSTHVERFYLATRAPWCRIAHLVLVNLRPLRAAAIRAERDPANTGGAVTRGRGKGDEARKPRELGFMAAGGGQRGAFAAVRPEGEISREELPLRLTRTCTPYASVWLMLMWRAVIDAESSRQRTGFSLQAINSIAA